MSEELKQTSAEQTPAEAAQEDLSAQAPAEAVQAESPAEAVPETDAQERYHPRPKYQLVLAWVLLGIVVVGIILWLLEIATAGSLFGLLD